MKRLLFIGPAPQNIGGISIHIRRLVRLIKDDYIIDYIDEGHNRYDGIFNIRSGNIIKYFFKVAQADIVHINSGIWSLRALNIIACKVFLHKKVVVTIHRDPNIEPHSGLTKYLLKRCDYAILVNREGYDAMFTCGHCRYILLPAFLPPIMEAEPELPNGILDWICKVREEKDSYILCSNAYRLMIHEGCDLYGLDVCIEAISILKKIGKGKLFFLLFVLASNPDQQERLIKYKAKIKEHEIEDRILIWEKPASFVRVIQKCDLVLRTTNTDGDAVSIREALYFGKPVIASDIVRRPDGVHLFKTRDVEDLVAQIQSVRDNETKNYQTEPIDYRALYHSFYD